MNFSSLFSLWRRQLPLSALHACDFVIMRLISDQIALRPLPRRILRRNLALIPLSLPLKNTIWNLIRASIALNYYCDQQVAPHIICIYKFIILRSFTHLLQVAFRRFKVELITLYVLYMRATGFSVLLLSCVFTLFK